MYLAQQKGTRMSQQDGLNRRSFLRNAGLTALAGAVTAGTPLGSVEAAAAAALAPANGKYDFDTIYNRIGTTSVKFDQQLRTYGPGSVEVGMGIADMDFRAAPSITKALMDRLQHENWGYLDTGAYYKEFTDHIVSWNKKRYDLEIDPASMVLTTGVHPGLIVTLATFTAPGTKVLLQTPTYNGFYSDLRATSTLAEESRLKVVDGKYQMDFEDFERRISSDTNTFILCNPQNPTGNCWSKEDLLTIGEICLKHRVLVLADEIHCDYVTKDAKYTPFASLPNEAVVRNSFTFKAASKSFGLAAHKVGWFFSTNKELLDKVKHNHRADISTLGLVANHGAITGGEDWLSQCVEYIEGNHDFAVQYIKANLPMVKAYKPQGTYLLWLDVSAVAEKIGAAQQAADLNKAKKPGANDVTPETMVERWFVKNAKVHLNQGRSYGPGGENHMRMNLATSRKLIEKALGNMTRALQNT